MLNNRLTSEDHKEASMKYEIMLEGKLPNQLNLINEKLVNEKAIRKECKRLEIEQYYLYLKDHWKEASLNKDKEFGIEDSRGMIHRFPSSYMESVRHDESLRDVLNLVNKNSEFGKDLLNLEKLENSKNSQYMNQQQIQSQSQNQIQNQRQTQQQIQRDQGLMPAKEKEEMRHYVTNIVDKNYKDLMDGFEKNKRVEIEDFKGEKFTSPYRYIATIREDKDLMGFMKKESIVLREIQRQIDYEKQSQLQKQWQLER